ncbi:MAG: hypothetical protein ACHP7I_02175 [Terriglobales bacterium]
MDGTFNQLGSPTVEIEVSGPLGNRTKFTAMVDTGFSGFLLLPILSAFPIGLILHSMMPITLADGSNQTKLTCLGGIHFDNAYVIGVIIIEWANTDVLVGMDFLRKFGKRLTVDPVNNHIEIVAASPPPNQLALLTTAAPTEPPK